MGRKRASCRSRGKPKRRRRRSYPEETERFLRRLAGPRCRKSYCDENGKKAHHCTTVNFTREIKSHPNDSLCLCCRDSRRQISERVWRATKRGAFIGVSISAQEFEVEWKDRKDGRGRFPIDRYHRTNALVETFQALWCEMDRGTVREQWDRLHSFGVFPTMIVWSGGKSLQAYWVLAEPTDRERFNSVMPRLCAQLFGDGNAILAMHQLRLPGSIHFKTLERGRLRRARLIHDEERFPAIEQIEAALTLTPEEVTSYMDKELGRKPRNRAGSGSGAEETNDKSTCGDGNRAEPRHTVGIEELELRVFEDGGDDAILDAAHRVFGDLRKDERHATTLAMIRWCYWSMCLSERDSCRIVKRYYRLRPGTSKGATERLEEVTRRVDALVANWYGKARAPEVEYASITDLEDCAYEIALAIPPEWSAADACGFQDWLTGFVRYLTALAHGRGLTCFRSHSLHARKDIERLGRGACGKPETGRNAHDCDERESRQRRRPGDRVACSQGLNREGRRMAFRGFRHLLSTGFVVQVKEYMQGNRTRLYDITIPILSPDVWHHHRHETIAEWSARAAKRAAQDADADGHAC